MLWEAMQPVFEWIEDVAITIIDGLGSVFEKVANVFDEKGPQISEIFKSVGDVISSVWELVRPIFEALRELVSDVFDTIGNVVGSTIGGVIDTLDGLLKFLSGVFTGDWEKVWEGLLNIFKGIWNTIVGILEGAVNLIIDGINFLVRALNKLHIDIPDNPFTGPLTLGFNIPELSKISIPRLAQGAVIPPNREFLAVLGDQRSGTNIEAPLETIKQALSEVMQSQSSGEIVVNITTTLDGRVLARNQVRHINDMTRQAGKPVLLF